MVDFPCHVRFRGCIGPFHQPFFLGLQWLVWGWPVEANALVHSRAMKLGKTTVSWKECGVHGSLVSVL